jgi:hypothetical protein
MGGYVPPKMDIAPDGQPYGDQPRYRTVQGPDGSPRQQRIPTAAEFEAMQAATPQQQTQIAGQIAGGTFGQPQPTGEGPTMTIQNGQYQETFDQGRLTSTNRPPLESQGGAGAHKDYMAEALKSFGQLPPQRVTDRFGRSVPNRDYENAMAHVRQSALVLQRDDIKRQDEERKAAALEKKAEAKSHQDNLDKDYKLHYGNLGKELKRVRDDNAKGGKEPLPDWAKDEDSMHAEAVRRAKRANEDLHGRGQQPAGAGQAAAPAAKKVEPLADDVATTAEIKAKLAERAAAQALAARKEEARRAAIERPGGGGIGLSNFFK